MAFHSVSTYPFNFLSRIKHDTCKTELKNNSQVMQAKTKFLPTFFIKHVVNLVTYTYIPLRIISKQRKWYSQMDNPSSYLSSFYLRLMTSNKTSLLKHNASLQRTSYGHKPSSFFRKYLSKIIYSLKIRYFGLQTRN